MLNSRTIAVSDNVLPRFIQDVPSTVGGSSGPAPAPLPEVVIDTVNTDHFVSSQPQVPVTEEAPSIEIKKKDSEKKSWKTRVVEYCTSCFACSPVSLKKLVVFLFNPDYIVHPTIKRVVGMVAGAGIIVGASMMYWQMGLPIFGNLMTSVGAFVAINGIEAMMGVLALIFSSPRSVDRTTPQEMQKLTLIIPVHGAQKDIEPTIKTAIRAGYLPENIFVVENTGGKYSLQEGQVHRLLSKQEYSSVQYLAIESFGNKPAAEYLGLLAAKKQGCVYATSVDDDVKLPKGFDAGVKLFNERRVKLVGYRIKPANNINYWTQGQRREYTDSGMHKVLQDKAGNVLSVHGAISTGEIDTLLDCMAVHPVTGQFLAEDARKSYSVRWKGWRIVMAPTEPVKTMVPDDLVTHSWQQLGSWLWGAHNQTTNMVEDAVFDCPRAFSVKQIMQTALRKMYQLQAIFTNASDVLRPLVLISMAPNWFFWAVLGGIWEVGNITAIARDVFWVPHYRRESFGNVKRIFSSVFYHHLSFIYKTVQLVNGTVGAYVKYVGAGASKETDFAVSTPYPEELIQILQERDLNIRNKALGGYLNKVAKDPRMQMAT